MNDSGVLSFKTPEEMHNYMENLGLGFEYGCVRENNPVSCHSWAVWCSDYKKLVTKSINILKENCFKRNYGDSCYRFGSLKIIGGTGVLRDPLEAFRSFEHGCKAGKQGKCCQAAGRLVADGVSSHAPNLSIAMQLFELGCHDNVPESCFHLGGAAMVLAKKNDALTDLKKSSGASIDHLRLKAFKAWIEGCKLGHELCCRNIAKMYSTGDGVEMDELKAKDFLSKADELAASKNVKLTANNNISCTKS
ncbi:Cytochrome c oxidase assembly factor 7 [Schistosoma japonicum]|nr:Cytochrome c oxidase assembly factor 7 [Schistosoma japonicum]